MNIFGFPLCRSAGAGDAAAFHESAGQKARCRSAVYWRWHGHCTVCCSALMMMMVMMMIEVVPAGL